MNAGIHVEILDIGSLVTVDQTDRNMVRVDFLGEKFWIEKDLQEMPRVGDDE